MYSFSLHLSQRNVFRSNASILGAGISELQVRWDDRLDEHGDACNPGDGNEKVFPKSRTRDSICCYWFVVAPKFDEAIGLVVAVVE